MPAPPPLPASLSSRLQSSIDPATGTCRHHPQVKLCELVQNNTRWVVRRKICYKCGTRTNGKFHRPGVAVKNGPVESKSRRSESGGRSRTRSASLSRRASLTVTGERARSMSRERGHTSVVGAAGVDRPPSTNRQRRSRLSGGDWNEVKVSPPPAAAPAAVVVQPPSTQPSAPPAASTAAQEQEFDESDPIIYVPALMPDEELPPPPPRTEEEAERHAERLEMRRAHDVDKNKHSKEHAGAEPRAKDGKVSHHPVKTRELPKNTDLSTLPSANVMALLESNHGKKQPKKHRSAANNNKVEEASETSSISTASAKIYQLEPDEMLVHHPHLSGVDAPTPHNPPKEIFPNAKSRSISRGKREEKAKKSVDPEECQELAILDPPPQEHKRRSRKTVVSSVPAVEKTRAKSVENHRGHHRKTTEERPKSVMGHDVVVKPYKSHTASKSVDHRRSSSTSRRKSVPHAEIKSLSASTARMSRREHQTVIDSTAPRSKSRDVARESIRSRSKTRSAVGSNGHSHPSSSKSKKNASGTIATSCTQPLSVSSDEIVIAKKEETPEVIYKKRARPKSEAKSMPVAHIALNDSCDEKSHASSISSSSTVEESFAYSDDGKVGGGGDKSRKSGLQSNSHSARASLVLKDVRGSAVGLASRGRSTLIGLKDTSKKWQSALFM